MDQVFVTAIGTAATTPTPNRGVTSQLVQIAGVRILIDCGEGTQVALRRHAQTAPAALDRILLTHYHADHYLGLPGLLKTRSLVEGAQPPIIHCLPRTARDLVRLMEATFTGADLYRIEPLEADQVVAIADDWSLQLIEAEHRVAAASYVISERDQPGRFDSQAAQAAGAQMGPQMGTLARGQTLVLDDGTKLNGADFLGALRVGRKLAFSGDTRPLERFAAAAAGAELVVHEATFLSEDQGLALQTAHSTAREAAQVARVAGARNLWLTHLSSRYQVRQLLEEARSAAGDVRVSAPRDGDCVEVRSGRVLVAERTGAPA